MNELTRIEKLEQAKVLMNPIRVTLLNLLAEPKTCQELAEEIEMSQQRVNNHIQEMQKAGLIKRVESRQKRNLIEGVYQATSKAYWFSPKLSRPSGKGTAKRLQEELSLHNLLKISERLQEDVSDLLTQDDGKEVPSIGVTAEIRLRSAAEREAFSRDFLKALHSVIEKYQGSGEETENYTAMIVCYPKERT